MCESQGYQFLMFNIPPMWVLFSLVLASVALYLWTRFVAQPVDHFCTAKRVIWRGIFLRRVNGCMIVVITVATLVFGFWLSAPDPCYSNFLAHFGF